MPWFPAVGERVTIRGNGHYVGQSGTITNSPGKVFTGWTVALDSGGYAGVWTRDLRAEDSQSGPPAE